MKNLLLIEEEAILGFGRKESQGTNNPSNTFIFFDLNVLTPKFLKKKKIVVSFSFKHTKKKFWGFFVITCDKISGLLRLALFFY